MRYVVLTYTQLLLLAVFCSIITAVLLVINSWYKEFTLLPEVHRNSAGVCTRVVNFQNGQAFNCEDVNVLLRQYRNVQDK